MPDLLEQSDRSGRVIASNKRLDNAFRNDEWKELAEALPCGSGTLAAYEIPNKKLESKIEILDSISGIRYVFPVPDEHVGKRDVILLVEHPNFSLVKDGGDLIIQARGVNALQFPTSKSGWFLTDERYGIPTGKETGKNEKNARYLVRTDKRIGLVVRNKIELDTRLGFVGGRDVLLYHPSSYPLGVVVESAVTQVKYSTNLN